MECIIVFRDLDLRLVRKLIKREKEQCTITSIKIGDPPHVSIIKYDENGNIISFISYFEQEDGFNLIIHKLQTYGATIQIYEKKGNSIEKTRYSPRSAYFKIPTIEITENPHRKISYNFEEPDFKDPKKVSVFKNFSSPTTYRKTNDGFYYLDSNKLTNIFTRTKGITLQQVYQRLNISSNHQYSSKFFEILKQAINNTVAIDIPAELQETLDALPALCITQNNVPINSYTENKKDFDSNAEVDYTESYRF